MFLLLFSPYLSLLYILINSLRTKTINNRYWLYTVLILPIMGIYWFPWGDSQSHFSYYYSEIVATYYNDYSISSTYWFYDLVIAKIANLIGNYVWGYFFWLIFPLSVFYYAIKSNINPNDKTKISLFLYFILFIGIREYLDLNRCTSAILLMVSSIMLYRTNKMLCALCFLSSLLLHDAVRFYLLLIPAGYYLSKLSKRNIYILYVLVTFISVVIINYVAPLLFSDRNLSLYFGENWQNNKGVNSGFMYIMGIVNVLILILQFVLILENRKFINRYLYIAFITSTFVVACGFSMWVLRERFIIFSNVIAASIILTNWSALKCTKVLNVTKSKILHWTNLMFITKICLNLLLLYSSHFIFNSATKDNEEEFRIVSHSFYIPTILLLDIDTFGFSDKKYLTLYERVYNSLE